MEEIFDIKSILIELGFDPKDDGAQFYRMANIARGGDNKSALRISRSTGYWTDFVDSKGGSLKDLINVTLGFTKPYQLKDWLENKKIELPKLDEVVPNLEIQKTFDVGVVNSLVKNTEYWNKRGISDKTLNLFGGGVCLTDHLKDRYVFPIWNNKKELIGLAGRDITAAKKIKWKLMGEKQEWVWPASVNLAEIRAAKSVILTESIGDSLALFECGIKNSICLFGVNVSWKIINFLLTIKPERVIIATNNDTEFGGSDTGNESALKIEKKLNKWLDSKIEIRLPKKANDLNDLLVKFGREEIIEQYTN